MSEDCVFCREINGSRETNFAFRYPEIKSRILYETESLLSFPCIGQLTEGHFLIVPRVHDCTFGHVHSRLKSLRVELEEQIKGMHKRLGFKLENSLFFEHGALNSSNGGCGIYHAHIHVVPNANAINPKDVFDFEQKEAYCDIHSALRSVTEGEPYLLVGNRKYGFYSRTISTPLPSQTLRKNVANILGVEKWNWRDTIREESLVSLLKEAS